MSIKNGASDPKGAKGRRTSPPGIMPSRPAKELPDEQSLTIHIYKIGIHSVALPPHPCLPKEGRPMVHGKPPQDPKRFYAFPF